jgi:hypothetical protein
MNWKEAKEILIKEGAIHVMDMLYVFIRVLDRIEKTETKDIQMFKVKTKNHHVRLIVDYSWDGPGILVRKKGFMKDWSFIEKKAVPACLVQDIFEPTCSKEKRKRLVGKMMELKAFW